MLLTATAEFPAGGEPVEDVDRKMLSERDRPLSRVARLKSGRIVIDLVRMREPAKEKREKGEPDANGCLPTTIRATEITGSVQRLR